MADAVGIKRIPAYVRQTGLKDFRRLVFGAVPIPDAVTDEPEAWDSACC